MVPTCFRPSSSRSSCSAAECASTSLQGRRGRAPRSRARGPASARAWSSSCRPPASRSGSTSPSSRASRLRRPSSSSRTEGRTASWTSARRTPIARDLPEEPAWYSRRTSSGVEMSRDRRPPGELPGRLRVELVPLLGVDALARLQVLHDRQERGRRRGVAQEGRGRRRGGAGGAGRIGLDLHAPEHRLSLRGGGQAGADPRPAAVRAVREGDAREGRRLHRRPGHAGPAPEVPGVRRADRRGHGPLLFLLRVRGPGGVRAPLPRQGADGRTGGVLRGDGIHGSKKLGRGSVSGEIIAGLEPIEATKRGIDRIVDAGAFPTVCIFRPTVGSEMENVPPPEPDGMKEVFAYLYGPAATRACRWGCCRSRSRSSCSPRRPPSCCRRACRRASTSGSSRRCASCATLCRVEAQVPIQSCPGGGSSRGLSLFRLRRPSLPIPASGRMR